MGRYFARAIHPPFWYIEEGTNPSSFFERLSGRAITLDLKCLDGDWSVYEWDGKDENDLNLIATICYLNLALDDFPGIGLFLISQEEFKKIGVAIKPKENSMVSNAPIHRNLAHSNDLGFSDINGGNLIALSMLILNSQNDDFLNRDYSTEDIFDFILHNREAVYSSFVPNPSSSKDCAKRLLKKYKTLFTAICANRNILPEQLLPPGVFLTSKGK